MTAYSCIYWLFRRIEEELKRLLVFVLFVFCNSSDNFGVGVDGEFSCWLLFGETFCSLFLVNLATYFGNAFWWKKADLRNDGGNT